MDVRERRRLLLAGVVAAAAAALAIVTNLATDEPPSWLDWWLHPVSRAWIAVGVVLLIVVALTVQLARLEGSGGPVALWYVDQGDEDLAPVQRPDELGSVVSALLRQPRRRFLRWPRCEGRLGAGGAKEVVALSTSLQGVGGFGKTTLARMVLRERRVQRRFEQRFLWVTMGRDVASDAIAGRVEDVARRLDRAALGAATTVPADALQVATSHLRSALSSVVTARGRALIVLDDVWDARQVAPFAAAAEDYPRVRVLVTTRSTAVLGGTQIAVDRVSPAQAEKLLTRGVEGLSVATRDALLEVTGRWPLILASINRILRSPYLPAEDQAQALLSRYRTDGLQALDHPGATVSDPAAADDPALRGLRVGATIDAGRDLLAEPDRPRLAELAIFAEDEHIPIDLISQLWKARASTGIDIIATGVLLQEMADYGLLTLHRDHTNTGQNSVSLHDVYRDHLRRELDAQNPGSAQLNAFLLEAAAFTLLSDLPVAADVCSPTPSGKPTPSRDTVAGARWWQLGAQQRYLWDNLAYHLHEIGDDALANDVITRPAWIAARLRRTGLAAPLADLQTIATPEALGLRRRLAQAAHLLGPTDPAHAQTAVLWSRIQDWPTWSAQDDTKSAPSTVSDMPSQARPSPDQRGMGLHQPHLEPCLPLPDIPHPALRVTLTGHTNSVTSMAISPDGSWLATAGNDGTVRIWDRASGIQTGSLAGHTGWVGSVAISPDGTWLATAGNDGTVRIWDRANGTQTATLAGYRGAVTFVAISPDGAWLATASYGTVPILDRATAAQIAALDDWTGEVKSIAISRDGTWMATTSSRRARIWDRASGAQTAVLTADDSSVMSVAISPDGSWLATVSNDQTLRIWDRASGAQIAALHGLPRYATSVAISPDGTWLATAGHQDGTVRIWDRPDAAQTGRCSLATTVASSPDGTWLGAASDDGTVRIWEQGSNTQTASLIVRAAWVRLMAISSDGNWVVTAQSMEVGIWDRASGTQTGSLVGLPEWGGSVAISPDGSWLAGGGASDGLVRIWDRASGAQTAALACHRSGVSSVAISPDGSWLAAASHGAVLIWDRANGTQTATLAGHTGTVRSVAISPDGTWLATAGDDGTVRIWDPASGTQTASLNDLPSSKTSSVAISPNGTWLAIVGEDRTVRIWDRAAGAVATLMIVEDPLSSVVWSGDRVYLGGARGLYGFRLVGG